MVVHKSKLFAWTLGRLGYAAITFGDHVFIAPRYANDQRLLRHEEKHTEQYARFGFLGFICRYVYFHFKFGYKKNPLEIEAMEAENA